MITDKTQIAYRWIGGIIMSCMNQFQIDCANVLIDLFAAKYGNEELTTELKLLSSAKYNEIHGIMV